MIYISDNTYLKKILQKYKKIRQVHKKISLKPGKVIKVKILKTYMTSMHK